MPLSERQRIDERMDDPTLDPALHRQALDGLARINKFSGGANVLWPDLTQLARRLGRPLTVLDVATGAGDTPIWLARKAAKAGVTLHLTGCDLSPTAIEHARANAQAANVAVEWLVADALTQLPRQFDVVTCSLFLHHLDRPDAVALLRNMRSAATHLMLVNDLARSRLNHLLVWLACHVLSRSPVVRFDGPASVRSAFTASEALTLAREAGWTTADVRGRFPCRFLLRGQPA